MEVEMESMDEEAEAEMAPKKLRIRGEATVPPAKREPTCHEEKALITPNDKNNWDYVPGTIRQPASMLGALLRKFWPGFYSTVPDGPQKLAYSWAAYEVADCPGYGKASDAVIGKFWAHYRVLDELRDRANVVLTKCCQRMTRHVFYNQKITCIAHFKAEQGERVTKREILKKKIMLTKEEFATLSKL